MFNIKDLIDISDKLGIIQAVKSKLISQPDPAAAHLVAALEEVSKIYYSFESELTKFLALTLEASEIAQERGTLLELEGGKIKVRMGVARGHCKKIKNIYDKYLCPWLRRVLAPEENQLVEGLFSEMSLTDHSMLNLIDDVANWLATEAEETLHLLEAGDLKAAQARVRAARLQVTPARRAISAALRRIQDIEAAFVEASGAI